MMMAACGGCVWRRASVHECAALRVHLLPLVRRFELTQPKPRHFRPHHRAVDEIEAQDAEALVVAGRFEVGGQEPGRQVRPLPRLQIGDDERDVVHDVNPAHRGVELEAVEQRDATVDQRDVAEMEVAVAFAHESTGRGGAERWPRRWCAPRRSRSGALQDPTGSRGSSITASSWVKFSSAGCRMSWSRPYGASAPARVVP